MEASPSYLYGKEKIAHAMKKYLGDIKIIFMLRDPVYRLISFYYHLRAKMVISDISFEEFLEKAIEDSKKEDIDDYYRRAIREGKYSDYLENWFEIFGN